MLSAKYNLTQIKVTSSVFKKNAMPTQPPPSKEQLDSLFAEAPQTPECPPTNSSRKVKAVRWLAGDASDRCYYRVFLQDNSTMVLMLLSREDQKSLSNGAYDWVLIQKTLKAHGVSTPTLLYSSPKLGCLVIEDYGDEMLETQIHALLGSHQNKQVEEFYLLATDMIANFIKVPSTAKEVWCQRSFDTHRFAWELEFFKKYYIEQYLQKALSSAELKSFAQDVTRLSARLASYSKYFVHRDFHSRNLMVRDQELAVIDFQDARIGAAAYDLVSLIYDSYIPFTTEARNILFQKCLGRLDQILHSKIVDEIRNTYTAVLLQRQLKVLGSFSYLKFVKNKPNYLQYMPVAIDTLHSVDVYSADWPFLSGDFLHMLSLR